MDRYVSVPRRMCSADDVPEEAKRLARAFSLEIQVSDDEEELRIVAVPKVKLAVFRDSYCPGRIWSLDIVDEFVDLSKDAKLVIADTYYKPKIQEAHALKFRQRLDAVGDQKVSVVVDNTTIFSEIIKQKT